MNSIYQTNPSHVMKWRTGNKLTICYTIEHTRFDDEIEELYFSNIEKINCYSLDEFIKQLNYVQIQGFKNIDISTQVIENDPINNNLTHNLLIEDIANNIDISLNNSYIQTLEKKNREMKTNSDMVLKELELHQAFVKHYKSEKLFNNFKELN